MLFQIINEEMTEQQMRKLMGKARSKGAAEKRELVFGVLLTLAERSQYTLQELPANAQRRIEGAPSALEWVQMVERAVTAAARSRTLVKARERAWTLVAHCTRRGTREGTLMPL